MRERRYPLESGPVTENEAVDRVQGRSLAVISQPVLTLLRSLTGILPPRLSSVGSGGQVPSAERSKPNRKVNFLRSTRALQRSRIPGFGVMLSQSETP